MSESTIPNINDIDPAILEELLTNRKLEKETEERSKRTKFFVLLLILLLLFLLFLLFLFYLLFQPAKTPEASGAGLKHLYSIYNLERPLGVTVDSESNVYVSDTGNRRVLVFEEGKLQKRLGSTFAPDNMIAVYGSAVDDEEDLYFVADFRTRSVNAYDLKTDKFKYRFPDFPYGPQYGNSGFTPYDVEYYKGQLYVASNQGIYIFDKKGKLDRFYTKYSDGTRKVDFKFPDAIALDKEGNMYVTDTVNRRIVALRNNGTTLWLSGRPDVGVRLVSFFGLPKGIDLDSQGRIFVSDSFHHEIVAMDKDGSLLGILGERGVKDGQFNFPEQLEFGPDDTMYVVDRENNRVQALEVGQIGAPSDDRRRDFVNGYRKFTN